MPESTAYLVGIHHYSFRAGIPARIVGVAFGTPEGCRRRLCYKIKFRDGRVDSVPVSDHQNFRIISGDDVRRGRIPNVSR